MPGDARAVYADAACEKREWRERLKAAGVEDRTQHYRVRGQPLLAHCQGVRTVPIGRIGGAVERTFSSLEGRYRIDRVRYRGLAACALHLDLAAIAYDLDRPAAMPAR